MSPLQGDTPTAPTQALAERGHTGGGCLIVGEAKEAQAKLPSTVCTIGLRHLLSSDLSLIDMETEAGGGGGCVCVCACVGMHKEIEECAFGILGGQPY